MSPRKKPANAYHHGDLRAALIEAAVELIREQGVHGFSLRECARRAGVSHAAPYRHFRDKNALLGAVAREGFTWLHDAGLVAMSKHEDPRARLDAYGVAYVRFAYEHPEHHRVMHGGTIDEPDPQTQAAGDRALQLLVDATAVVVGDGRDPWPPALAKWSLVHGLAMLILDCRVPQALVQDAEAVERLTLQTLNQWDNSQLSPA